MNTDIPMKTTWIFGRGASVACGVNWEEPAEWKTKSRDERIQNIDENLTREMKSLEVGRNPYSQLISILKNNTRPPHRHFFITTNWDYLLQREVDNIIVDNAIPAWLVESHVFHLNGSIEKRGNAQHRPPIIFPDDEKRTGLQTLEFSRAMNEFVWGTFFIIIGLSLQCKVDEQILKLLKPDEDNLPFGEGKYLLINNSLEDLDRLASGIKKYLPAARIIPKQVDFKSWIKNAVSEACFDPFDTLSYV